MALSMSVSAGAHNARHNTDLAYRANLRNVANNVTEFVVFQNWCDENNERWAEALDSGCAIAIEKFIADWNGRADANRWKHAAQPDDNIWDNELK